MHFSLALQDAQIMGEKEGFERGFKRGIEKGRKNIIFDMFRLDRTVDEISSFTGYEKSKILAYKKEFDQINTPL